jgi:CDP-diacylglycerol--serine O-phosphatidyltransferase
MMSTVRYPSGKKVDLQTQTRLRTFVFLVLTLGLVVVYKEVAFMGLCLGYIFFGLIRHWRRSRAAKGQPAQ